MLSRPPSQVISVVAPERFVLGIHCDQQAVLAGPDCEHIGTRSLVLRARQPRRHLDHDSVTIVDRQFAGNSFPLGNLAEGLHLPPEASPIRTLTMAWFASMVACHPWFGTGNGVG